jgi:hypothetical protein
MMTSKGEVGGKSLASLLVAYIRENPLAWEDAVDLLEKISLVEDDSPRAMIERALACGVLLERRRGKNGNSIHEKTTESPTEANPHVG